MFNKINDENKTEALLVRGVNWIGDAVMTIPALRLLRRSMRDTRLCLLVKPWVAPLFEKDPDVDEIIIYSQEYAGIGGMIRLAKRLRNYRFSHAVLFQNAFGAALLAFLSGIPKRLGYDRDGRRLLLTHAAELDLQVSKLHHVDYYLNLVRSAGCDGPSQIPWLFLDLEERLNARQQLSKLKRPVIAINPGATYGSSKRWHAGRFAEVASRIILDLNGSALLLGGPSERSITDEIVAKLDASVVSEETLLDLAGKTSLRDLVSVISESDILVTNDSGPMHIGYAVGTPVVAIFGSTSSEQTGPVGKTDVVIKKQIDCSPCFERTCRRKNLECMELISSDEVYVAVKDLTRSSKAVFFDRDGTLCRDAHYLSKMEDFELFDSVASLGLLRQKGFELIGITNQSGIARGLIEEEFVKKVNAVFVEEYGFRDFYYCPHHPDDHCSCRKPQPGMMIRAGNDHAINLKKSYVVGDNEADMMLAKAVGAKGILVLTGKLQSSGYADFIVQGLEEAVKIIVSMDEHATDS